MVVCCGVLEELKAVGDGGQGPAVAFLKSSRWRWTMGTCCDVFEKLRALVDRRSPLHRPGACCEVPLNLCDE